jgi:hypothetical protein
MENIDTSFRLPSLGARIIYLFTGILLPLWCFIVAFGGCPDEPTWQSGLFSDYVTFLLSGPVHYAFYPFLLYSLISLSLLLINPNYFISFFAVCFGIYTGIILALQFSIIMGMVFELGIVGWLLFILIIICLPLVLYWIAKKVIRKLGKKRGWLSIVGLILIGLGIYIGCSYYYHWYEPWYSRILWSCFMASLIAPFYWSFIAYLLMSIKILKHQQINNSLKFGRLLLFISWLSGYMVAWRIALITLFEKYNSLPTEPPKCYISTATARGHSWIVNSTLTRTTNGSIFPINHQMQYFKCAELILQQSFPRIHQLSRKLYNNIGRFLASGIIHSIIADMVYLLLKPLEWLVRFILIWLVPDIDRLAEKIYKGDK